MPNKNLFHFWFDEFYIGFMLVRLNQLIINNFLKNNVKLT